MKHGQKECRKLQELNQEFVVLHFLNVAAVS